MKSNPQDNTNIDEIIEKALAMHERGISVSQILKTFPKQSETLNEIFNISEVLNKSHVRIKAPKKVLKTIMSDIKTGTKTPIKQGFLIPSPFSIFATAQRGSLAFAILLFTVFSVTYPGELNPWASKGNSESNILKIAQAAETINNSIDFENSSTTAYAQETELDNILLPGFHDQVDSALDFYIAQAQK